MPCRHLTVIYPQLIGGKLYLLLSATGQLAQLDRNPNAKTTSNRHYKSTLHIRNIYPKLQT